MVYHKENACVYQDMIIQWFKTMTTNEYFRSVKTLGCEPVNKRLWQRNYYDHIIRNEKSYAKIVEYIKNNPMNWEKDSLFSED